MRLAASIIAVALAVGGCSSDIATVDRERVEDCLTANGAAPRPFGATGSRVPAEYRALTAENGARGALAARGGATSIGESFAYLFFFNGAERAKAVYDRVAGGQDKVKVTGPSQRTRTVPATRRQNVIVLYGRERAYGRTPGAADRKLLERCFDEAS